VLTVDPWAALRAASALPVSDVLVDELGPAVRFGLLATAEPPFSRLNRVPLSVLLGRVHMLVPGLGFASFLVGEFNRQLAVVQRRFGVERLDEVAVPGPRHMYLHRG